MNTIVNELTATQGTMPDTYTWLAKLAIAEQLEYTPSHVENNLANILAPRLWDITEQTIQQYQEAEAKANTKTTIEPLPTLKLTHKPGLTLNEDTENNHTNIFYSELPEWWFTFSIDLLDTKLTASISTNMQDIELTETNNPLTELKQLQDVQLPKLSEWLTDCYTVLEWAQHQPWDTITPPQAQ